MSSAVIDLQNDLLIPNCDVLSTLRKAHVIASKLGLSEFDGWINSELNGYKCRKDELPEYRLIRGNIRAYNPYRGWIPCIIPNREIDEALSTVDLIDSISSLIELEKTAKNNTIAYRYTGEMYAKIAKMLQSPVDMDIQVFISVSDMRSVIERVKNCLIEWTLKLESQGIKGDGMVFSRTEQESAKGIPQQINNYYGTIVNGSVSQSQLISGNDHIINYNDVQTIMKELKDSINKEVVNPEDKETALELLQDISDKLENKNKPSIIKASAKGLAGFLSNVGASVTAELVVAKLQGRF